MQHADSNSHHGPAFKILEYDAAFKMRYHPAFQKKSRSFKFFYKMTQLSKKNRIPQLFVIKLPSFGAEDYA
jgi:hypothetical protein